MKKIIEIRRLSFIYPNETHALKDIDMDVYENECVGLIGPNGAGKTTLLLHMNGVLRPNTGSVKVLGMNVTDENIRYIRRCVGLVFQNPDDQLFSPTVFDDVAFGPLQLDKDKKEVEKKVDNALKQTDMLNHKYRAPHHLSFGEKKRVSIATVLSMDPKILVLDEPTSNMDPYHRKQFIDFLKKINITKIIATHDLELVSELCNRIIIMDRGSVTASGKTSKIIKDVKLLKMNKLM